MRLPQRRQARPGVALVEGAIVSFVFLTLILVTIDISIAVFRQFTISQAARAGARLAIVHGVNAPTAASFGGPWGPSQVTALASSNDARAVALAPKCQTCQLSQTQITMQWPDGNNNVGSRVQVTITTVHQPILTSWLGLAYTLQASSTMLIAH
jgi:Flp pilus assembly protein TadG